MRIRIPLVALAVLVAAPIARAGVPLFIPTQGRLLDAEDKPVEETVQMTFGIYDVPQTPPGSAPVAPLWTATYSVKVANGFFSVQLGDTSTSQNPLDAGLFDGSGNRWLGVKVAESDEFTPRLRLAAVPFALLAERALKADDAKTLEGETAATLRDASKLTGVLPASALGTGSTGLTTVGTITTGEWKGAPISDAYVAGASTWSAKLAAVAHDASLDGNGGDTPLKVVYGDSANTAAAGNDPRFADLDERVTAVGGKLADYQPKAGGAFTGAVTGPAFTATGAVTAQSLSATQDLSVTRNALVSGDFRTAGNIRGAVVSSNRSFVGLEHNILFNATTRFTVTQSGVASLHLPSLFDGALAPSYTAVAPNVSSPTVITIDDLPAYHVQAGAHIGWSTRYWPATKFKVEIFDTHSNRNEWKVLADHTTTAYTGSDFQVSFADAVVKTIRITVIEASGDQGKLGFSEIWFLHSEVAAPYASLVPTTEIFQASMTAANVNAIRTAGSGNGSGTAVFGAVGTNTNTAVFEPLSGGEIRIKKPGVVRVFTSFDCVPTSDYCQLGVFVNSTRRFLALSGQALNWDGLTGYVTWKVNAGDTIRVQLDRVKNLDAGEWSTIQIDWTGIL